MPPTPPQEFDRTFDDFSGGWVASRNASRMRDNELRDMCNYVVGPRGELMTRPPLILSGSIVAPDAIIGLGISNGQSTEGATNPWGVVIADTGSGFTYYGLDHTTNLITLTDVDNDVDQVPKPPVKIMKYGDIWYMMWWDVSFHIARIDPRALLSGGDLNFQATGIYRAGTDLVTSVAPTVVAAAGGTLADGVYQCGYTFYNDRTGVESRISTTASVTLAAPNSQIDWSNISIAVTSPGTGYAQVTQRRLYRTLPNQENEYYLVDTLADNTTTVYAGDSVEPASLGRRVSTNLGQLSRESGVAAAYGGFTIWRDRFWYVGNSQQGNTPIPNLLSYSLVGNVESGTLDNTIPIGQNTFGRLVAVEAMDERLIVMMTNSIFKLTGTGPSNFTVTKLNSPTGTPCPFAHAVIPGGIIFYGSDGYFYFTDGVNVRNISERLGKLNLFDDVGPDISAEGNVTTEVVSVAWPSRNLFLTSRFTTAAPDEAKVYAYDWIKDAWSYWVTSTVGDDVVPRPRCWALGFDATNFGNRLYVGAQGTSTAHVMTFEDDLNISDANVTDESPNVEGATVDVAPLRRLRTKSFDAGSFGGEPGQAFIVRQVSLRIEWPVPIVNASSPDTNWPLEFDFTLLSDGNSNTSSDSVVASKTGVSWSTTDFMNGQWHAVGLSSQEQAVTSIALDILSNAGEAPRRHSITGIRFEGILLDRRLAQPGAMFRSNVV